MPGGVPGRGSHIRWAKPVSTKKMRSCPEQAYSVGGLMGPISGFALQGPEEGDVYPGRRRRVEGRGAAVPCGWPGSGGGGAGARAAGLSQEGRWGGDWPTEVRGRRRAAAIRKNVWRHARVRLLLPCPYSTPLDLRLGLFPGWRSRLGAWAWAQRGGGSPRRAAVAMAPGREPLDPGPG